MTSKRKIIGVFILCAALLSTTPAHANVMVPLACTGWFGMLILLIPISIIEGYVLMYAGIGGGRSLRYSAFANITSTLAGFPLALYCDVIIDRKTSLYDMSPSPETIKNEPSTRWFLTMFLLLFVFCFFLSWVIEALVVMKMAAHLPRWDVIGAVLGANLVTYGLITLILGAWMLWVYIASIGKAEEWEQARQMQRDIVARSNAQNELSTFELANEFARHGMAELRRAEIRIESTDEVSKLSDPAIVSEQPTGGAVDWPDISIETGSMAA